MTSASAAFKNFGNEDSGALKNLKRLIWLYFWLLMFEGALRKWILPGLSGPLLIVRDPVLILIYALAAAKGKFPRNGFVAGLFAVGILATLTSFIQIGINVIPSTWAITLYGFHANFLHIPLIFVIAETFSRRDIEAVGKWLLLLGPGMAVIVFMQFRADPSAWINAGAGIGAEQIGAAVNGIEKVRPAGLFSYNTGLGAYLATTAAFGLHNFFQDKSAINKHLGTIGMGCVLIMLPLSVSRSTVVGVILVIVTAVLCGLSNPTLWRKSLKIAIAGGIAFLVLASWSVLKEGAAIMSTRFADADGIKVGIVDRFFASFFDAWDVASSASFFGAGLGMGTNAASGLLLGRASFMLAEGEWSRVVLEMGPILGFAYIIQRVKLTFDLGLQSVAKLRTSDTLPALLFTAWAPLFINGQFGQATALGFAALGGGLCMGATRAKEEILFPEPPSPKPPNQTIKRLPGRSAYAQKLHGS